MRDNPSKKYTTAKLFANAPVMHSRSPPPIIMLDESDQGPPPLPRREPEKTQPPLPKSPPPTMPPKPTPPKETSLIPNLPLPPKASQPKLGAVAKTKTLSKPHLAYSESPQKTDTDTLNKWAARESTKHPFRSLPRRKTSLERMSSPSEEESVEDLRNTLDRRNNRVSLESGRRQARRHVTVTSEYDQMLQRHCYDQQEKTSANSDYGRDRSSGNQNQTASTRPRDPHRASERQDRSCNRSERSSPTQPERGRDNSMEERTQIRRERSVAEKLASLPTQRIRHFDLKFNAYQYAPWPKAALPPNNTEDG